MTTPLTFKFKFRAPASSKTTPPLFVDFGKRVSAPDVAKMMQEGKMPLPDAWHDLTKGQLADLGYDAVRYSKKFKVKYVDVVTKGRKQYDS
jgi:hypothetical protein